MTIKGGVRMKRARLAVLLVAGISFVVSMNYATAKGKMGTGQPNALGAEVWEHITKAPYTKWKMWPGREAFYPGTEPHGVLLTTYVTGNAYEAIEAKKRPLPDGSIIVKENYTPDKTLAAITVMMKKSGYNPDAGDWFWAKYAPGGKIMAEGKIGGCIGCHASSSTGDYIMTK